MSHPSASHNIRVVLVDDDPVVLVAIRSQLEELGLDVISVADSAKAFKVIEKVEPSLCIIDWMMPGMGGLDLVRQIRGDANTRDIYAIMLTAKDRPEELMAAFEAGVDDYLAKAANPGEITSRINAAKRVIMLQKELVERVEAIASLNAQLVTMNEQLNDMASTDVLTQLPNRRSVFDRLEYMWASWVRHRTPLSIAMLDIDHFKQVNDTYGHDAGDDVIRHVSSILMNQVREVDAIGRYGGEEFIIGISHQLHDDVVSGLDRLRVDVKSRAAKTKCGDITTSISIGVAEADDSITSLDGLIKSADIAMYDAKRSGRDRVCFYQKNDLVIK